MILTFFYHLPNSGAQNLLKENLALSKLLSANYILELSKSLLLFSS